MRRVLIVDDHPGFRAAARTLLVAEGFEVVGEASDGAEAVEAAASLEPDLVLLDVQLPDMDGFAVAVALGRLPHPPGVVLTSSREAVDFGPLIGSCGACGFVPKDELCGARLAALVP